MLESKRFVNFFSENARGLKNNDPSRPQAEIFCGLRISSPPCSLLLYYEFAKATDEKVFSIFKGLLHDLKKPFSTTDRDCVLLSPAWLYTSLVIFSFVKAISDPPLSFVKDQ